jgi:uncharacterized protein with PIN domain
MFRKLPGVILIDSIISKCRICNRPLKACKIEVVYKSNNNHKLTANLLTDVLYCEGCNQGYLLSIFRETVDPFHKIWVVNEVIVNKQMNSSNSNPAVQKSKSEMDRQIVREISKVIIKNQCSNCREPLTNKKIILVFNSIDKKKEFKEYTEAMYCQQCNYWYLNETSYHRIQKAYLPHPLPVKHNDTMKPKPKSNTSQLTKAEKIKRDIEATTIRTKMSPSINNSFDRTGRFIHSNATKKWKDYYSE